MEQNIYRYQLQNEELSILLNILEMFCFDAESIYYSFYNVNINQLIYILRLNRLRDIIFEDVLIRNQHRDYFINTIHNTICNNKNSIINSININDEATPNHIIQNEHLEILYTLINEFILNENQELPSFNLHNLSIRLGMNRLLGLPLLQNIVTRNNNNIINQCIQRIINSNHTLTTIPTCCICMERRSSSVFVPCGHICCCIHCSENIHNCPLCRTIIRISQTIYV